MMSTTASSFFYTTDDNLKLHYLFWPKERSDSVCLFLHGFTNDAHIWDFIAPQLQQNHNILAVDFRGHGDSAWDSNANYAHERLCADILQLIQSQPFKTWHIVGHSLGARVALLLLARNALPQVTSLTIIDTGPEVRAVGVNKVRQDAESAPSYFASEQAYFEYLASIYLFAQTPRLRHVAHHGLKPFENGFISKTDPAFTTALWKPNSHLANSDDLRYPQNDELWAALERLTLRCLIVRGQASAILSRQTAEKMQAVMHDAQLVTINRAGHALMVDNPEDFEQAVLRFIAQ